MTMLNKKIYVKSIIIGCILFLFAGGGWAWELEIEAIGEDLGGNDLSSITIGLRHKDSQLEAPPPDPDYSVRMVLFSSDKSETYKEQYYMGGDLFYEWLIGVNPSGNYFGEHTAHISWNPTDFSSGLYQLLDGDTGDEILIDDMRIKQFHEITGGDSVQFFRIRYYPVGLIHALKILQAISNIDTEEIYSAVDADEDAQKGLMDIIFSLQKEIDLRSSNP